MPIPAAGNMSVADMYTGMEGAPFSNDPFSNQDVFGMSGSLGKMTGQSLEDMMMGMSMDSTMEGMAGSLGSMGGAGSHPLGGFLSSSPNALEFEAIVPSENKVKQEGATQPMACPISPAQRIKRDRAASLRTRGSAMSVGSEGAHPAQKMRQGPGPGSVKSNGGDDVLGWSISPSLLDDELGM